MSGFLLDTCVLSELPKKNPNQGLVDWVLAQDNNRLFISSVSLGEIQKGIAKLPESAKKQQLATWIEADLLSRFDGRIIAFGRLEALDWGDIQANAEITGKTMPVLDSLIAATAITHNLILVTRNVKDVESSGVRLLNPWI